MIRLSLRLTLNGGREAVIRLVTTAIAVAIGAAMLLMTLAALNAVHAQNSRYAWLETGFVPNEPTYATASSAAEPTWLRVRRDWFDSELIGRVDVAATGPTSPVPPGIPALPGPGQYYASPAMSRLLRANPSGTLADRYPGQEVGIIGPSALPSPSSLIIVVGHTAEELSQLPDAKPITSMVTTPPNECGNCPVSVGIDANGIDLILFVVAAALLFPLLIFIGAATRLSAARREQRFAAMRLVGATPRQVSIISVVESSVAAVIGVAFGFGVFYSLRPVVAGIAFTGAPFFTSDLSLHLVDVLAIAIGVPLAAAGAARLALRRVNISPLGVTRRVTPRPPRAYRLIPLVAGLAELTYFVVAGRPETTPGQIQAYLPGILLVLIGLITAGPWLTTVGSRVMARRTNRPATLIAGRRLGDNPKVAFRAISGLVLALFVTTVAIAIMASIDANDAAPPAGSAARVTILDDFTRFTGTPPDIPASIPPEVVGRLSSIPGVHGVTLLHVDLSSPSAPDHRPDSVASCAELLRTPAVGRCPPGAETATVIPYLGGREDQSSTVWPASTVPVARLQDLPVQAIIVATDGSTAAIESARTTLELAYPHYDAPNTMGELWTQRSRLDAAYQQLANVVILVSLPIAGCSLAVSVAAGLSDRKRPFSLLRLTGVPVAMLRRVVALESAVPLVLGALVAIAAGFVAAGLFLSSQLDYSLVAPGAEYFVIVLLGLVASLGVIASTLPLLQRSTGPETARND